MKNSKNNKNKNLKKWVKPKLFKGEIKFQNLFNAACGGGYGPCSACTTGSVQNAQ